MTRKLDPEIVATIAAIGFDVYQTSDPYWRTYLYFTDGQRIGYLQRGDFGGLTLSTVHVPNKTTGTGFCVTDDRDPPLTLTLAELERAFALAPNWASGRQHRETVRKWPNMAAFLKSNRGLELVAKGQATVR